MADEASMRLVASANEKVLSARAAVSRPSLVNYANFVYFNLFEFILLKFSK